MTPSDAVLFVVVAGVVLVAVGIDLAVVVGWLTRISFRRDTEP